MKDNENGPKLVKKMAETILESKEYSMFPHFFSALSSFNMKLFDFYSLASQLINDGSYECIVALHTSGYDFNNAPTSKPTLLKTAISCRRNEIVKYLISCGTKLSNDPTSENMLSFACTSNLSVEVFEELLKLESTQKQKEMALCNAIHIRNMPIIKLLIEKTKFDPNSNTYDPFMQAIIIDNIEIARLVFEWQEYNISVRPIMTMVQRNCLEILDMVLEKRPNVLNMIYPLNFTPLHWACKTGKIETVRILLKHNAKTDVQNCECLIPIFFAMANGHHDIVELLETHEKTQKIQTQ
jgi:ankyrin repeat protein